MRFRFQIAFLFLFSVLRADSRRGVFYSDSYLGFQQPNFSSTAFYFHYTNPQTGLSKTSLFPVAEIPNITVVGLRALDWISNDGLLITPFDFSMSFANPWSNNYYLASLNYRCGIGYEKLVYGKSKSGEKERSQPLMSWTSKRRKKPRFDIRTRFALEFAAMHTEFVMEKVYASGLRTDQSGDFITAVVRDNGFRIIPYAGISVTFKNGLEFRLALEWNYIFFSSETLVMGGHASKDTIYPKHEYMYDADHKPFSGKIYSPTTFGIRFELVNFSTLNE